MEGNVEERQGRKSESRPHSKREKRKQRKAWLKQKRNREVSKPEPPVEPQGESAHVADHTSAVKLKAKSKDDNHLSRGKKLVELLRKRKGQQQKEPLLAKISKRPSKHTSNEKPALVRKKTEKSHLNEINRDLLSIDNSNSIGSGTFGNCYSALYRDQFSVVVKEIETKDDSCKGMDRARKEVLHEAVIITGIGDHPGIPYLFGICTDRVLYYLVLQCHFMEGCSITLSKAVSAGVITRSKELVEILKKTCEALQNIHDKGYLHNDLKANNVVLDGQKDKPVIIDFGKSCQIAKAKLGKPKLAVDEAISRYPHIAPEIHRGQRQSSFGAMVKRLLKDKKFHSLSERSNKKVSGKSSKPTKALRSITSIVTY